MFNLNRRSLTVNLPVFGFGMSQTSLTRLDVSQSRSVTAPVRRRVSQRVDQPHYSRADPVPGYLFRDTMEVFQQKALEDKQRQEAKRRKIFEIRERQEMLRKMRLEGKKVVDEWTESLCEYVQQTDTSINMLPGKLTPEKVYDRAAVAAATKLVNSARKSQTKKLSRKMKLSLKKSANDNPTARRLALSTDSELKNLNDTSEFKDCPSMRHVGKTHRGNSRSKETSKRTGNTVTAFLSDCDRCPEHKSGISLDPQNPDNFSSIVEKSGLKLRRCSVSIEKIVLKSDECGHLEVNNLTNTGAQRSCEKESEQQVSRSGEDRAKVTPARQKCASGRGDNIFGGSTDTSLAEVSCGGDSSGDISLSVSLHTCPTCGDQLQRGRFVQHMRLCLSQHSDDVHTAPDEDEDAAAGTCKPSIPAQHGQDSRVTSRDGGLQMDYMFCQFCQKDLSHMNSHRRTLHINKCIDQDEAAKQKEEEKQRALEAAKTQVLNCPMCGKVLKTNSSRKSHLKNCAAKLGVDTEQLLEIVKRQKEEHEVKIAAGILPVSSRPRGPRQPDSAGPHKRVAALPKSKLDEDIQLALALSSSLNPDAAATTTAGGVFTGGEGTSRRGRKQQHQQEDYLLHTLTHRQAADRISSRVSELITQEDHDDDCDVVPTLPPVSCELLQTEGRSQVHVSTDSGSLTRKMFWGRTSLDDNTDITSETNTDPRIQFYVPVLMPPVEVSTVVAGSKVRRMSEIPGRRRSFDADQGQDKDKSCESGEDDQPYPSTQTAALLAEMAAEADNLSHSQYPSSQQSFSAAQREVEEDLFAAYSSLVNRRDYSDIRIKAAGGVTLFAHRVILSVRCPSLLQLADEESGEVNLTDWSPDCVLTVLRFVYAGLVDTDPDVLPGTLSLANRLNLTSLKDVAGRTLWSPPDGVSQLESNADCELSASQRRKQNITEQRKHVSFGRKSFEENSMGRDKLIDLSVDQDQTSVTTLDDIPPALQQQQHKSPKEQIQEQTLPLAVPAVESKNESSDNKSSSCDDRKTQRLSQPDVAGGILVADTGGGIISPEETDFISLGSSFESEKSVKYVTTASEVKEPVCSKSKSCVDREDKKLECKPTVPTSQTSPDNTVHFQGQEASKKPGIPDFEDDIEDCLFVDIENDECCVPEDDVADVNMGQNRSRDDAVPPQSCVLSRPEARNSPASFSSDDEIQMLELDENQATNVTVHHDVRTFSAEKSGEAASEIKDAGLTEGEKNTDTGDTDVEITSVGSDCDLFEDDIDLSLLPNTPQQTQKQCFVSDKSDKGHTDKRSSQLAASPQLSVDKSDSTSLLDPANSSRSECHSQRSVKRKSSGTENAQTERDDRCRSPWSSPHPKKRRQITDTEGCFPSFSVSAVDCSNQTSCLSSPVCREFKTSTPQAASAQSHDRAVSCGGGKEGTDNSGETEQASRPRVRRDHTTSRVSVTCGEGSTSHSQSQTPNFSHGNVSCVGETLSKATPASSVRWDSSHNPVSVVEQDSLYVTPVVSQNRTRSTFQLVTPSDNISYSQGQQDHSAALSVSAPPVKPQTGSGRFVDDRHLPHHTQHLSLGSVQAAREQLAPVTVVSADEGDQKSSHSPSGDASDSDIEIVDTSLTEARPPSPKFSAVSRPPSSQSSSQLQSSSQSSSLRKAQGQLHSFSQSRRQTHRNSVSPTVKSSRELRSNRMEPDAGPSPDPACVDDVWEGFEDMDAYNPDILLDLDPDDKGDVDFIVCLNLLYTLFRLVEVDVDFIVCLNLLYTLFRLVEGDVDFIVCLNLLYTLFCLVEAKKAESTPTSTRSKTDDPVRQITSHEHTPLTAPDTPTRALIHLAKQMRRRFSSEGDKSCDHLRSRQVTPEKTATPCSWREVSVRLSPLPASLFKTPTSSSGTTTTKTPHPQAALSRQVGSPGSCGPVDRKSTSPSVKVVSPPGGFIVDEAEQADVSFLWAEENAPDEDGLLTGGVQNVEPTHEAAPAVTPKERRQVPKTKRGIAAWVPPSPFTPMPAYDVMATPDLKREVQKFGIKPLGKKRMKLVLKDIYHKTHQYETDSEYEDVGDTSPPPDVCDKHGDGHGKKLVERGQKPKQKKAGVKKQKEQAAADVRKENPPAAKKTKRGLASATTVVLPPQEPREAKMTAGNSSASDSGPDQGKPKKTKRGLASGSSHPLGQLGHESRPHEGHRTTQGPETVARLQTSPKRPVAQSLHGESDVSECCSSPEKDAMSSSQDSDYSERPDMSVYEEAGADNDDDDLTPSQQVTCSVLFIT
ncbi:hypothetical protein BaRGS_00005011 [Batillaria attramentaria]|uniref:BTB domain-containing protein n=1 Tax=Batillaria attramentaria TaxID=370345 RepID=A0ABD0LWU9_9CAEN